MGILCFLQQICRSWLLLLVVWGFLRWGEGSEALIRCFFFPNQAPQLCLDSVLAEASSLPVCVCYSIPEYVHGRVLAVLVIGVMLLLKNAGMAAHVPLHCPGTGSGVGLGADVSVATCSFCTERSCAAELRLNLMVFPWVRWQVGGGSPDPLHNEGLLVSERLLHCCAGRSWERSRGNICSHWQGKIDLHDHCWLLFGCPKISIMKLFIHFPSKHQCFTSAAWSRRFSAGLCSWPVSRVSWGKTTRCVSELLPNSKKALLLSQMATSKAEKKQVC